MKISVVIPLYNKSYSIKRCLDSIVNQSVNPHEIIIVDDGSTDDGLKFAKEYSKSTSLSFVFLEQKNSGVSIARNNGIKAAKSEFIALLDADDEWLSFHLESMISLINDFPDAIVYGCGHYKKINSCCPIDMPSPMADTYRGYINNFFKASTKGSVLNSSKSIFRKSDAVLLGGFPEGIAAAEDLFFWIKLASFGKVAFKSERSVIVHIEQDLSRSKRKGAIPYPLLYYKNKPIPDNIKCYLRYILLRHFLGALSEGDRSFSLKLIFNAFSMFPVYCFLLNIIFLVPTSFISYVRRITRKKVKNNMTV